MNRKYDEGFKREAVRLVLERGLRTREVESNFRITHGVLKGCVQKHRDNQDTALVKNLDPQRQKRN